MSDKVKNLLRSRRTNRRAVTIALNSLDANRSIENVIACKENINENVVRIKEIDRQILTVYEQAESDDEIGQVLDNEIFEKILMRILYVSRK